jgi:glycosyltransferase involved in cell wall biosynthesis
MKNILIDFEKLKDPFCGLGQYCAHLKTFFDQSDPRPSYWLPNKFEKLAKKLPFILPRSDVFHATHQDSPYFPWSKKTKYVLTIHDLNALAENTNPFFQASYKKTLQKKIDRASIVTFISDFTRSEVMRQFKVEKEKTRIIYNGISLGNVSESPAIQSKSPFIYAIGTVVPKKNFNVLIDFLKLLPDYSIILSGTLYHDYAKAMQERIHTEGLQERFLLTGTVNEHEKLWYYQNASAFIFPSLLEGFGLPVAEAMSQGLPLFLSDKTSLPEIGGPDAYYFSSFDALAMKKVFLEGMKDFNEEKKARLIERSKLFSWEKAAAEYMEIYKRL